MAAGRFTYLEDCHVIRVTDKAVQIQYRGEPYWFPRSCVENDGDNLRAGEGGYTVAVTTRMAREKGIDADE